ncbi:MAG: hypothetical protein LUD25_01420 [Coriobacteriaceae bacterium]|nr:hypothetical protein [Coriobacteriaceae bacterium]
MPPISDTLDELSCDLLAQALDLLEDEDALPVLLAVDCEDGYLAFDGDSPDNCYMQACTYVTDLHDACSAYALVYDGFVSADDADDGAPALIVEFAERGMDNAWSGYLPYHSDADGHIVADGDPQPSGAEELLFG